MVRKKVLCGSNKRAMAHYTSVDRAIKMFITVGEAVRSTCGNSHEKKEEEEENNRFHLSLHQTIL